MKRIIPIIFTIVWVVLAVDMLIVPACETDPIMRLVEAFLVFGVMPCVACCRFYNQHGLR